MWKTLLNAETGTASLFITCATGKMTVEKTVTKQCLCARIKHYCVIWTPTYNVTTASVFLTVPIVKPVPTVLRTFCNCANVGFLITKIKQTLRNFCFSQPAILTKSLNAGMASV